MILRSLKVNHWRHRLTPLTVEFQPGLNIVAGPNEAGKTTLREALEYGLFERPDSTRAGLQVIRPKGRDLKPVVTVEFESGGRAYRVEKTFLETRRHTLLQQWEQGEWRPVAEDRDAQARLDGVLEEDGLTHYRQVIWSPQGEGLRILDGKLPAGLKERLTGILAGLLLTEADRKVIETVEREWGQRFTPTRRLPPAGSQRQRAQAELAEAEDLAAAAETEGRAYDRLGADLEAAGQAVAERAKENTRVQAEFEQARSAKTAWDHYRRLAAEAETVRGRAESLRQLRRRWIEMVEKLEHLEERRQGALADLDRARAGVGAKRAEYERARKAEDRREAERQALTSRRELLRLLRARHLERRIAHLAAGEPAAPTPADMRALRELMRQADTDRARLEAMALTVRLTPDRPVTGRSAVDEGPEQEFRLEPPGGEEWKATRSLRLRLDGIAGIDVRTGMENAAELKADLERTLRRLQAELDRWIAPREELAARWTDLEDRFERAESARAERLQLQGIYRSAFDWPAGEAEGGIETWSHAHPGKWARAVEEGWESLDPDRLSELETAAAAAVTALAAESRAAAPALAERQRDLQHEEQARSAAVAVLEGLAGEKRTLLDALGEVREQAVATEPALGIHSFRRWAADEQFYGTVERDCELLARLTALAEYRAGSWADFNREAERRRPQGSEITEADLLDLERGAGDMTRALGEARRKRDEFSGEVKARADGLGERRHLARERREEARRRAAAEEREAAAWDLIRTALEDERRGELATLLDPVRRRVEGRLGRLTGERYQGVELDPESLRPTAVAGGDIRLDVDSELSFGTQEQLALLVRLALAELMAPDSRQVLILDDPLVNTDPARQAAAWAILLEAAAGLQVILLTCHPVPREVEALAPIIRLA